MNIIKFVVYNVSFDSLMPLPSVLHRGHNTECSNNYADNVTNGRAFGLHTASAKATDRPIQPAKSPGTNWINGSGSGHDPLKTWDSKLVDSSLTILKVPASSNKIKDQAVLDLAKSLDKEAAGVDGKASEKVRKKGHHNYSNGENHFQSRNSPPSFVIPAKIIQLQFTLRKAKVLSEMSTSVNIRVMTVTDNCSNRYCRSSLKRSLWARPKVKTLTE